MAGRAGVRPLATMATIVLGVAALYLARALLVPLALALLLTFLIHPAVTFLQRRGLGRIPAVVAVTVLTFALVSTAAWGIGQQLVSLADDVPRYRQNLVDKIAALRRAGRGGALERAQSAAEDVVAEIQKSDAPARRDAPLPVVIRSEPTGLWQLPTILEALGTAGVVIVLVIFMLLEREELRDRLVRLIGYGQVTATTRALDEAGRRISRYLLMQTIINGSFGLGIGVGLFVIGVPYAALWGALAAALRFVPYVGPWLSALLVLLFCLASFPGWREPLLTAGVFVALELFSNLLMEPWLYGQSAGVSQVGLLVSIAFWTWLWGPIGLLLATPLTVCLVVVGKYVPGMEFLSVLIADQPPLAAHARLYQRLLAADQDEAAEILDDELEARPLDVVLDEVVLPALSHARQDRRAGRISPEDEQAIWRLCREIVESAAREHALPLEEGPSAGREPAPRRPLRVVGIPARDEGDELALIMLRAILAPAWCEMEILSPHLLAAEVIATLEARDPAVVCIGALPSGGRASHTRYLCKRLRARFPQADIVVGRWGPRTGGDDEAIALLRAAGATEVGTTLRETRDQLEVLGRLDRDRPASPAPTDAAASAPGAGPTRA